MTTFNHVTDIGHRDIVSSLEDNIKSFLDWAFLNIGGFVNVDIPLSISSNGYHKLTTVSGDPSVTYPRTWESARKDWVYETGINYGSGSLNPNQISGIYLNNTFLPAPTGSGSYSYYIDYPKGRINFTNNVSATSTVALSYAFRLIKIYKSSDNLIWKDIIYNKYNPGVNSTDPKYSANNIQIPAIVVEITPRTISTPYELGNTANILQQDVLLHIFSETSTQRNSIIDILLKQKDKTLNLYDINKVIKNNKQPLNYRGEINPNRLNYDQISNNLSYVSNRCYLINSFLSETESFSPSLHYGVVRWSAQIYP